MTGLVILNHEGKAFSRMGLNVGFVPCTDGMGAKNSFCRILADLTAACQSRLTRWALTRMSRSGKCWIIAEVSSGSANTWSIADEDAMVVIFV